MISPPEVIGARVRSRAVMVKTSGTVRRIDIVPVVKLVPSLFGEWARLEFDGSGAVLNPLTGAAVPAFALVEGRHRAAGARYSVTIETPKLELPEARRAEFDREMAALGGGRHTEEEWAAHYQRRNDAMVRVGVEQSTCFVTLKEDDARGMAATVSEDRGRWAVTVDLRRGVLPRIEVAGWVDLTAMIKDEVGSGCLAQLLGGSGEGSATLDLGTLAGNGGGLLEAKGQANRFRGATQAEVAGSAREWKLDGALSLRARGLGRVVLLVARRRIRRHLEGEIKRFWASSADWVTTAEADLRALAAAAEREGGEEVLVRRMLWDAEFDLPRP